MRVVNRKRGIEGLPAQIALVVFLVISLALTLMPVLITLLMSVKNKNDIMAYKMWYLPQTGWMFSNYKVAFTSVSTQMLKTVAMDLGVTVFVMLFSCYTAFLFNFQRFGASKALFFMMILPMLVPSAILLSPTYIVATTLHINDNWWGIILPYLAGNQIATVFLLKVFMSQQPESLYEAARLDGAGKFRLYLHICLPLTFPIMMIQGIGIFASIYNDLLWPQLIFSRNVEAGTLMPYLKNAIYGFEQGEQYAVYLVAGIPLIFSTIISIKFFINGEFASGMKL